MKRSWRRVESMCKSFAQLSSVTKKLSQIDLLLLNWAIPERKERGVLMTYFFEKTTGFSRFVILLLQILNKTKLYPWKSCKIDFCGSSWKSKTKNQDSCLVPFFLIAPKNLTNFLFNFCEIKNNPLSNWTWMLFVHDL